MTGRAVDPPLERLYSELRHLRRKAGGVSYGDIARKCALSKTTVAAIFTGQGRKNPPRWERVARVFEVLREELERTGVDPDRSLGTKEELHRLYVEVTSEPTADGTTGGPVGVTAADRPAPPRGDPWPPIEDLPARLSPEPWPAFGDLFARFPGPGSPGAIDELPQYVPATTAPPEMEAVFAAMDAAPASGATAARLRRWFGPYGVRLLLAVEENNALAAFELGILLRNRDAVEEGSYFLGLARSWDADLTLNVRGLRAGDRVCGSIVKNICRRVAAAYEGVDSFMARLWAGYAETVYDALPLAALVPTRGRHARENPILTLFPSTEMSRIMETYWSAHPVEVAPEVLAALSVVHPPAVGDVASSWSHSPWDCLICQASDISVIANRYGNR
ncbi:helix-turn-helix domain-containing protein [Nonomuraea muscovyensis]